MSDGAEDDEEKKEETIPKAKVQHSSVGESEAKASSNDNETEAGEVPDAPRAFHRTLSIFFRHLAMQTTKDELETVTDRRWTERRLMMVRFRSVNNMRASVVCASRILRLNESSLDVVG